MTSPRLARYVDAVHIERALSIGRGAAAATPGSRAVISDEHLLALTSEEREQLARRLARLGSIVAPVTRPGRRHGGWLGGLALAACLAMIPWTVGLAARLPDRYVTNHWSATWVGFDTLLLASFAITAWTAWRRCRAALAATVVTVTLLSCDVWFDITTASNSSDLMVSMITAAAGVLPLNAALIYLVRRILRHEGG